MSQKDKEENLVVHRLDPESEVPAKNLWKASGTKGQDWESVEGDELTRDPEEALLESSPRIIKIPVGYTVVFTMVLVFLGIWGLVKYVEGERITRERLEELAIAEEQERQETREAVSLFTRLERAVSGYLTATSLEEKSNYVRQSERVAPLMKEYYDERPLQPRPYAKVDDFASLGIEKRSFMLVKVLLESEVKGRRALHLVVEETEEGDVLVDWESDVAYQPVRLEEFLETKSEQPRDFRFFVQKDNFYNFEFSDADRYQSLRLSDRDTEVYFFGYVERGSRAHQEIEKLLENSQNGYEPALLRVRFLPNSESFRSILVEDVVAPRWLYIDDPRGQSS